MSDTQTEKPLRERARAAAEQQERLTNERRAKQVAEEIGRFVESMELGFGIELEQPAELPVMIGGLKFSQFAGAPQVEVTGQCSNCGEVITAYRLVHDLVSLHEALTEPIPGSLHPGCLPETVTIELGSSQARLLRAINDHISERMEWLSRDVRQIAKRVGVEFEL